MTPASGAEVLSDAETQIRDLYREIAFIATQLKDRDMNEEIVNMMCAVHGIECSVIEVRAFLAEMGGGK